jgi:hypothetical protein
MIVVDAPQSTERRSDDSALYLSVLLRYVRSTRERKAVCEAHKRVPLVVESNNNEDDSPCYMLDASAEMWRCKGCFRLICDGFGAADDMPDHCDDCWALAHGIHL